MNESQNTPKSYRKNIIFLLCLCINLLSASSYSLQAPFYPSEAEKKGVRATLYGLVFGSYELVAFLTSPFLGKWIRNFEAKSFLGYGTAVHGAMVTLFGFLDYCDDEFTFVALSFILRIIEALGSTSAMIASLWFCTSIFTDNVATKIATLEMFYGFGTIIGPSLGGILYGIGGFYLPFVCSGLICEILAVLIYFIFPAGIKDRNKNESPGGWKKLIKSPSILVSISIGWVISVSLSYYITTLEPYLRIRYGVSIFESSLIIGLTGIGYAVCSPLTGRIIDRYVKPKWIVIVALLISVVFGTLAGPLPFLPVPKVLATSLTGIYVTYLSLSAAHVAAVLHALETAIKAGFPDDCQGFILGLYLSACSLGSFIGPTLSGMLFDTVGFAMGSIVLVVLNAIMLVVFYSLFVIYEQTDEKTDVSSENLKQTDSRKDEQKPSSPTIENAYSRA